MPFLSQNQRVGVGEKWATGADCADCSVPMLTGTDAKWELMELRRMLEITLGKSFAR